MRARQVIELAVGTGLLLGPLVYALSLDAAPAAECTAELAEPAPVTVVETVVVEHCEQPVPVEVEVEVPPEPEPEPEVELPLADLAKFLFVTDAGIVLSSEAERSWGTGRLFEPAGKVSFRAAKRANSTKVPAELWSMRGRSFDLYGADGKVCTARLGELRVVAQYAGWSLGGVLGDEWYEEDPEGASKTEIRKGLWQRDDLWLVAQIASDEPCKGALWARDAELPPPTVLRRSSASNPTVEARRVAFEKSEELAEAERSYRAEYAELAEHDPESLEYYSSWDTIVAQRGVELWSWLDAEGRPQLVGLEFGEEMGGCGSLSSQLTALDFVRDEAFVPVEHGYAPAAIFDADGDGQLELLYDNEIGDVSYWLVSETLEQAVAVEEDWYCPC